MHFPDECMINCSNGFNPPKIQENFIYYLTSYVFMNYHNEKRFKRDEKYHKFTSLAGMLKQIKKSTMIEYLVELRLNNCITWEIREYNCTEADIEYIRSHYE